MATVDEFTAPGNYPVLRVWPPEAPNRLWAFPVLGMVVKAIILIPVVIWIYLLILMVALASLLNSLNVLFSGQYWVPAYALGRGLLRLNSKVWLYAAGITDRYPGFGFNIAPEDRIGLDIPMPASPGRAFALPFLGGIVRGVLLIPFAVWESVIGYAAYLAVVVASIPVLFAGRYPVALMELVRDSLRLSLSYLSYGLGLSDSYPSFSISMRNPGVKWLFITLGILMVVAQVASSSSGRGS